MALLTYEECVRRALLGSGRGLARQELDAHVTRDALLEQVVAKAFNNATPITTVDFSGVLAGVVSSRPLAHPLTGVDLKSSTVMAVGNLNSLSLSDRVQAKMTLQDSPTFVCKIRMASFLSQGSGA